MLRFERITVEDFGPYKGRQQLQFPTGPGVVVLYGDNGRGKTSLLNAFRYALFGHVRREGDENVALHSIPNYETVRETGSHGFKVVLEFSFDGAQYELTRQTKARPGIEPSSDVDYNETKILRRNGDTLGPAELTTELSRIMPEEVSRFFLFDGELLREYEELLRRDSKLSEQIKDSIERILGVPVLKHARTDIYAQLESARKESRAVAARSKEGETIAAELENLAAEKAHLEGELERFQQDFKSLIGEKADLDGDIKKYTQVKSRMERRQDLERRLKEAEVQEEELRERLRLAMEDAWKDILYQKVKSVREHIEEEIDTLRRKAKAGEHFETLKRALEGTCPTCNQSVTGRAQEGVRIALEAVRANVASEGEIERERILTRRESRLRSFSPSDTRTSAREISRSLAEAIVRKETLRDDLRELRAQLADWKDAEARIGKTFDRFEACIEEMQIVENGIERCRKEIHAKQETTKALENKLSQIGNADISASQARVDLYKALFELFEEGISRYRDALRKEVESDASALFVQLKHEEGYTGLRINSNYGLNIVLDDEHEIPGHSAGERQVVALSLMGALQRNATLQGPIIMDSSFTRLDGKHKRNLLGSLNQLSPQVMLLVFEDELSPGLIREVLADQLLMEYEMVGETATHTCLQLRRS
jgi:DNA sulfur modification protein DndD